MTFLFDVFAKLIQQFDILKSLHLLIHDCCIWMDKDIIVKQVFQTESGRIFFPQFWASQFFVSLIYGLHTGSGRYKDLVGMNQNWDNFLLVVIFIFKNSKTYCKKRLKNHQKRYLGTCPNCFKWFHRPCLDSKRYIRLSMQSKTSYLSAQTRNPIFRLYIFFLISCSVHLATNTNPEFHETLRIIYYYVFFFNYLLKTEGKKTLLSNKNPSLEIEKFWSKMRFGIRFGC